MYVLKTCACPCKKLGLPFKTCAAFVAETCSCMQGFMFRAAFLRKVPLFIRNFSENVVLCLAAAAIESTSKRFLQLLTLDWRSALTSRVHKQYFDQMVRQPALSS